MGEFVRTKMNVKMESTIAKNLQFVRKVVSFALPSAATKQILFS